MAIRFQCSACAQPIEIDDEWALKAVACPYCRKTITAPAESTLGDISRIPTATALAPQPNVAAPAPPEPWSPQPQVAIEMHPNRIAVVAFVLACCMILCLASITITTGAHVSEFEKLQKAIESGGFLKAQQELLETHGGIPAWLIVMSVLEAVAGVAWIAAVVCGIFGVRRFQRRAFAVTTLVICGGVLVLLCAGSLFTL